MVIDANGRVCTKCKIYKKWIEFGFASKSRTGRSARCDECRRKEQKKRGDAYKAWQRYGLLDTEYQDLMKTQNCAVCDCILIDGNTSPNARHLDHDHKTGKVRGVLCSRCNKGIGLFDDNVERLIQAAEYLKRTTKHGAENH